MDHKTVALQLRKLASDPDNQTYIVRERGCMKGLMGFLDLKNEEVLLISLQAMHFLSTNPVNREPLSKEPGLLGKLVTLSDSDNPQIKRVASTVLRHLGDVVNKKAPTAASTARSESKRKQAFKPKYLYNVPLTVDGLHTESDESKVECALLRVAGVVSVTIDQSSGTVTVYSRKPEAAVLTSLTDAIVTSCPTMTVTRTAEAAVPEESTPSQPIKPTKPKPSYQPSAAAPSVSASPAKPKPSYQSRGSTAPAYLKPKKAKPGYLPSSAVGENGGGAAGNSGRPGYLSKGKQGAKSVVEYTGTSATGASMEARLKRQRQRQQEQQQKTESVKGFFGAVHSYFW